jgi:hypothetical protein
MVVKCSVVMSHFKIRQKTINANVPNMLLSKKEAKGSNLGQSGSLTGPREGKADCERRGLKMEFVRPMSCLYKDSLLCWDGLGGSKEDRCSKSPSYLWFSELYYLM